MVGKEGDGKQEEERSTLHLTLGNGILHKLSLNSLKLRPRFKSENQTSGKRIFSKFLLYLFNPSNQ